jgi:hypothetical protein
VLESPSYGFRFQGPADPTDPPAENSIISGVHTYDTCSSGISVWGVKWGEDPGDYDNIRDVIIEDTLLELGTHGCKNEIITVANGAVNITVRNNEIRLGDPAIDRGLLQGTPALDNAGPDLVAYEFDPDPATKPGQENSR